MEETSIGQMLMQQVVPQLITAFGLALGFLIMWLKSKTRKKIVENIDNDIAQKTLLWVNGLVMDLVSAASQTTVKELKQNLADGKITKEEYQISLAKIKSELLAKLSELTLGKIVGSGAAETIEKATEMLSNKIEAAVPLAKAAQKAATGAKPDPQ